MIKLDKNGWLSPRTLMDSSGNGILYTIMWAILKTPSEEDIAYINAQLDRCLISPGVYKRNPDGSYGPETFDDYLAIAVWCLVTGDTKRARDVLRYSNKGLWRSVHVFLGLFVVAAFPLLRLPMRPVLAFFGMFLNADTPKMYLDFLYFYGANLAGYKSKKLDMLYKNLAKSLSYEMDSDNSAVVAAKEYE